MADAQSTRAACGGVAAPRPPAWRSLRLAGWPGPRLLEMMFRLGHRAAGDLQIPDRLSARALAAAFCDVGWNGESGSAELGADGALFRTHHARSEEIDLLREDAGAIPDGELPEVVHASRKHAPEPSASPETRSAHRCAFSKFCRTFSLNSVATESLPISLGRSRWDETSRLPEARGGCSGCWIAMPYRSCCAPG